MQDNMNNNLPEFKNVEEVIAYGESLIKKIEYGIDFKDSINKLRLILENLDLRIRHLCCLLDD